METRNITITVPADYRLRAIVNEVPYHADPAKLSNDAWLHVVEYGFQRIVNDKTGGASKTAEDKAKIAGDTIARLEAATYVRRKPRGTSDPLVPYIRAILRTIMQAKPDASPAMVKRVAEYKAAKEADAKAAILDAWFEALPEDDQLKVTEKAEAAKAAADAERAKMKAQAEKLASDLGSMLDI